MHNIILRVSHRAVGLVTTVAGGGLGAGSIDGLGTNACFAAPMGIVVHPLTEIIYVADSTSNKIRTIDKNGNIIYDIIIAKSSNL